MLCGELAPSQGQVRLRGRTLADWPGQARARCLAVLPQVSTLGFAFGVEEVVGLGRLPHASGQQRDQKSSTPPWVRLMPCTVDRSYLALSGGERQRVHLARCWRSCGRGGGRHPAAGRAHFDAGPLHQHTTLQAVRRFADQGAAVMVILHDLNLAARYCDQILLLEQGRCHALGTPQQVLTPDALKAVFGIDVLVQPHPELGHPLIITR